MKKIFLSLLLTIGTIAYSNAIPIWLREMYSCTWHWSGPIVADGEDGNGFFKYKREMEGHSWLWGSCGKVIEKWVMPCGVYQDFRPIPLSYNTTPNYQLIANEMAVLALTYTNVDSAWTDTAQLRQSSTILNAAVAFKLSLAGYTFDPNWLTLVDEPCPVPQPTNTVIIPQYYTFINSDCTNNVTVAPNPNSGTFDLQINNYPDVVSLQVIRIFDMSSVLSLSSGFSLNNSIVLTTIPGYHYLRIVTKTGVIYKTIMIQ